MKKLLTFLTLLVLGLLLPSKASAMTVYFDNYGKNWTTPYCYYWGGSSGPSWPGYTMTQVSGSIWKITGIPDDSTGVIFNNNSEQTENLTPKANYLYNSSGQVGLFTLSMWDTSPKKLASATPNASGEFTFEVELDANQYIVLTANISATNWDEGDGGINNGRLSPSGNVEMPCTNVSFNNSNKDCWYASKAGTYTITVNLSTNKLTAETTPETLYLVTTGTAGTKSAAIDGTTFSYSGVYFHAGDQMYLSTDANGASGKNYGPSSNSDLIYSNEYSFDKVDSKYWVAPVDGTYEITVDWENSTFTATWEETIPTDMHLFANGALKSSAIITDGGQFVYQSVELAAGDKLILSTMSNASTGIYTPGSETTLVYAEPTQVSYSDNGYWVAPVNGTYVITVDWANKTLSATWTEEMPVVPTYVHMPLSPKDFEGGKKHYFLVGERMGEWHLQPEWEFAVVDNVDNTDNKKLVLEGRWIYSSKFAVAYVDNYYDYVFHKYNYYGAPAGTEGDYWVKTNEKIGLSSTAARFSKTKGSTWTNPGGVFYSNFPSEVGGSNYWQEDGTYMSKIECELSGGVPTSIQFTIADKTTTNDNRFFTLVGSNIYNDKFCNSTDVAKTTMYDKGKFTENGWQESWIQYDNNTHMPYVDGNQEYLYHTSYTPNYFTEHPSYFNTQKPNNGGEFPYTSSELQLVYYKNLTDTLSDPYLEYYKYFDGTKKGITNNSEVNGNGYNFTITTSNGDYTPGNNWGCYVIRDMWLGGEFKIWTGWGGNDDTTNGGTYNIATWHGENGGPEYDGKQVKGYDISSGKPVTFYNNNKNENNLNYYISDGTPNYYNRVILWYNIDEGIENSFIQLIQESAGPAILASPAPNPNKEDADNYIKYNWYLNPYQNDADKDRVVIGYEIQRYKYDNKGEKIFIGLPEEGYVNLQEEYGRTITVEKLQAGNAGDYKFTSFTDQGIDATKGFDPGLYQYDIIVTFEGGATKTAVSNKVAIYGNSMINLQANAYQLVRLSSEGKTKIKKDLGITDSDVDPEYMTYNPTVNGTWLLLDGETVDANKNGKPSNGYLIVDGAKANDFLLNNQDKYEWTSQFYVQCLDKDSYEDKMSEYIASGYILSSTIPTPVVKVAEGGNSVDAVEFKLGEDTYYSAILNRGGNLSNGIATVTLNYDYNDSENEPQKGESTALTNLNPVAPRPYNAEYYFTLETSTQSVPAQYAELTRTPVGAYGAHTPFEIVKSDDNLDITYLNTANGGGKLDTHVMVLNVEYNSPNVDADILNKYEVGQTVAVEDTNNTTLAESDRTVNYVDATDKAKVQYLTFKGLAPFNDVIPVVKYSNTVYQVRNGYVATAGDIADDKDDINASFGQDIQFNALHEFECVTTNINNVQLGYILRNNGTSMDLMYKGHESFVDNKPVLSAVGGNVKAGVNAPTMPFNYYAVVMDNTKGNNDDYSVYDYIWSHPACEHRTGNFDIDDTTGFVLNDEDPLIGTYIAKGLDVDENLTYTKFVVSQIFLFSNTNMNYFNITRIGDEVEEEASATEMALPTIGEMADGNVGGMPDDGTVPESVATYDSNKRWVMLGNSYASQNPVITGVEDVLAGESGEAVYYNLQGIRVDNPSVAGVYIRVQGKQIDKVVVK